MKQFTLQYNGSSRSVEMDRMPVPNDVPQ